MSFLPGRHPGLIKLLTDIASYLADAVHFDGSNDYLDRGNGLTGASDGKQLIISFWVLFGNDGSDIYLAQSSGNAFAVSRETGSSSLRIIVERSSGARVLELETSSNTARVADGWIHFLCSVDLTNTGKRHLYLNDASDMAVAVYTNADMDFTVANWRVGDRTQGGRKLEGDMSDFMLWTDQYLDLSVEANRRLFIDGAGNPVDPDVAEAALGTPIIRLSGPTADWHTNKGSGGGFAENGALTDAASSPSD